MKGAVAMAAQINGPTVSLEIDGIFYPSISAASQELKIHANTVRHRLYSLAFPTYKIVCVPAKKIVELLGKELIEPAPWAFNGDFSKRAPVLNPNFDPPRVIRYVGWARCMRCGSHYFSEDVIRIRICNLCKTL